MCGSTPYCYDAGLCEALPVECRDVEGICLSLVANSWPLPDAENLDRTLSADEIRALQDQHLMVARTKAARDRIRRSLADIWYDQTAYWNWIKRVQNGETSPPIDSGQNDARSTA
jgi:hypothetical protein